MLKLTPLLLMVLYGVIAFRFSVWRTLKELDARSNPLRDPVLQDHIQRLALPLGVSEIPVHVYEIDPVNGLAAPDGRIFLTRGFLRKYQNGDVTADELTSVIAHELAHSWSGNLVTNRTWNDFWLNEGFTVYFEQRIMESIYGKEVADILALIEFDELKDELKRIKASENPEDSKLHLALEGRNPDDGMTDIAYVKGAFFLKTLENEVGRTAFDAFLKKYFNTFQFKTVDTKQFVSFLKTRNRYCKRAAPSLNYLIAIVGAMDRAIPMLR